MNGQSFDWSSFAVSEWAAFTAEEWAGFFYAPAALFAVVARDVWQAGAVDAGAFLPGSSQSSIHRAGALEAKVTA